MKNISAIVFLLLIISGFCAITSSVPSTAAFSDVRTGSELEYYLKILTQRKVISGYPDGSFKPDRVINRAEALKMIFEAVGLSAAATDTSISERLFPDVDSTAWFGPYVAKAKKQNLVAGYPDGKFRPEQEVNRAEFVKMALAALPDFNPLSLNAYSAHKTFTDLDAKAWYVPYLGAAIDQGLVTGTGKFRPTASMTRQDAAEIIYHIVDNQGTTTNLFPVKPHSPTPVSDDQKATALDQAARSEEGATVIKPLEQNPKAWWNPPPLSQFSVVRRPGKTEIYSPYNGFDVFLDGEFDVSSTQNTPHLIMLKKAADGSCETQIAHFPYEMKGQTPAQYRAQEIERGEEGWGIEDALIKVYRNEFVRKKTDKGFEYYVYYYSTLRSESPDLSKTYRADNTPLRYIFADDGYAVIDTDCADVALLILNGFEFR